MSTKVVITGLGATTPLGGDVASTWDGLLSGRTNAQVLTDEAFADLPARIAAPAAVDPGEVLSRVEARKLDRYEQFAMVAAREAWKDSGLADADVPGERIAVSLGSGIGGLISMLNVYDTLRTKGPRHVTPYTIPMIMPNGGAAWVGLDIGARASVQTPVAACASGNEAIRHGLDLIRSGKADVAVVGGAEAAIHPLPMAAFGAMMALSRRNDDPQHASRPFDKARDGFLLGEGGAVMVLESAEHAERRGARVYAEVAGAGASADGHHIVQPDPEGKGNAFAMREALTNARLAPHEVIHINAHATSTPAGDVAEAVGIRAVFGEAAQNVVVTAPKGALGHLLGAAGVAESIATVLALYHRVVPPTINLDNLDDEVGLDVAVEPRKLPEGQLAAINNSFGFGGHNLVIAFRTV
ncbi:beta-ketoacyl-[acyl-carrier-protein] synthase family protein [Actinopolymorpha alba]|uniref:beta-ketoacyl-[acyl-carrier-protein] synthase family protein n=1 Tax=Actinopolymorpha alba TaxID=533267 RepID=UPI00037FD45B|nr:beta-ketoacyl-[acyl-carrier-protein] synthase family protein [Actinopolymorpha alba]